MRQDSIPGSRASAIPITAKLEAVRYSTRSYFRMLLVGYFEGIQSQRGIAWRCADSLSIRQFLGLKLTDHSPDHSSLTVIRERLPDAVHESVFEWVLKLASEKKSLEGRPLP